MNNGGLVPSCSPSQQTPETIFYDIPITKKQHVSTKYDSGGIQLYRGGKLQWAYWVLD